MKTFIFLNQFLCLWMAARLWFIGFLHRNSLTNYDNGDEQFRDIEDECSVVKCRISSTPDHHNLYNSAQSQQVSPPLTLSKLI